MNFTWKIKLLGGLAPWLIFGFLSCSHSPGTPTTAGRPHAVSAPPQDAAFAMYRQGRMRAALGAMAKSDTPEHVALRLLTRNRYAEVLALRGRSSRLLKSQAIAAWRAGRGRVLQRIVSMLQRQGVRDHELGALAALVSGLSSFRQARAGIPETRTFEIRYGVPIIEVTIRGTPHRFIFDTGAEVTVLDKRQMQTLGVTLSRGPKVTVRSNSGESRLSLGLLRSMRLLGLRLTDVPVLLSDLSSLPSFLKIVGILAPQDLLGRRGVEIDYRRGTVSLLSASLATGQALYFPYGRAVIAVVANAKSGPMGLFRVDTGGRRTLFTKAYAAVATRQAGWVIESPRTVQVVGLSRARRRRAMVKRPWICLSPAHGRHCFGLPWAPIDTTAADSLIAYSGKLGANAFRGRVLRLDYRNSRYTLTN